ncbi:MerR family transcriptional regulator [Natranaerobius trueperi]|uniref:HTH merR-type domain-containing protein n=1 Tax=Natranaerobius trueperi TaxID=759412 RepID=A0A226BYG5_9FIRM|nr:MerR family transcriptional regulator [Natranaerobius trueperi]OWZ83157.1 hypothetical protein CDO51_10020 [Natranaerobius trueperi]
MKYEYTIGEISRLYDIGQDSLRYYEKKGLISPKRKDNSYRVYTLDDIWRLNIIKDLRKLNFSTEKIREYLQNRNTQTTIELMEKKIEVVETEIEALLKMKDDLTDKVSNLKFYNQIENVGKLQLKQIPNRKIILINEKMSIDQEVDLAFRKLEGQDDKKLSLLGNKDMGVFISKEGIINEDYYDYDKAFFIVDDTEDYNAFLSEGLYLTTIYRGGYEKSGVLFREMKEYIDKNNLKISGEPLEIYRLDIHGTENRDEFITEIQIPVTKTLHV